MPQPKPPKCDTGLGLRWGQDTTCSKWGFFEGVHEQGEGKKWRSFNCCNSWPLSVETYARNQGLNGAASCKVQHEREVATITSGWQGSRGPVLRYNPNRQVAGN